jgi:hypothetical protein
MVPHAGWICSGAIAGKTIATVARSAGAKVDVVVVFGAVHTPLPLAVAALDSHSIWRVPGDECALPQALERKLMESSGLFVEDDRFHAREHAVEVEAPLIRQAWPGAALLPIEVPAIASAVSIGQATARQMIAWEMNAVYLASSDLTHYGPNYRFTPAGIGPEALRWAMDNDQRLLDRVLEGDAAEVVVEARARHNACGAGAIAAMMAACREYGAAQGRLLAHANSVQTLARVAPQGDDNAVGYAALIIGS